MDLSASIKDAIRDVPDFPKEGIIFKDITPILQHPALCSQIITAIATQFKDVDAVAGIEARGFLFGMSLASELGVPFIPVRKAGKLPYHKISYSYDLEYGSATVEIHEDAVKPGWNVLVHDDLLATGGTADAAATLIAKTGNVAGFSFLIDLTFLNGKEKLTNHANKIHSLVQY